MMFYNGISFERAYAYAVAVPGWFSREDAQCVGEILKRTKKGRIVEVGSFLGRSASFISHFAPVFCIDPWRKTRLFDIFKMHAIENNKYGYNITYLKGFDHDFWDKWNYGQIGFMYLEHRHTEESVYNSLLKWKKYMLPDASIVIHDTNMPEVMAGIVHSGISIRRIVKSMYQPAICYWESNKDCQTTVHSLI